MHRRLFLAAAAATLLAGCASTTLRDAWMEPGFAGPAFKRVLVLGVSADMTDRRVFEDIMVERVARTGAQAIPAYRFLPDSGKVPEADLDRAVQAAGADALLMSRIRRVDRQTSVSTQMVPARGAMGPWGRGWYGWYSGWFPVTEVRQYDVAVVETSVFAAAGRSLVWTGTTETFEPRSVARDAPGFADVIVRALVARGLLPAAK